MSMLESVISPKTVAVIGASNKEGSVGNAVMRNILSGGYNGRTYPVSLTSSMVLGLQCYRSVLQVPGPVDLAVIFVPSKAVSHVLEECGKKGVSGAVVISAGFKESGTEGRHLEEEIVKIAKGYGMRLVGPNCVGLINSAPEVSMNASFTKRMPKSGMVSLISQSGEICGAMLEYARSKGLGFS